MQKLIKPVSIWFLAFLLMLIPLTTPNVKRLPGWKELAFMALGASIVTRIATEKR